jgi:cytoskeletal protein RodZ
VDLFDSKENDEKVIEEQHEHQEDHTLVLTEPVPADPVVLPHRREEGQSLVQTIIMVIGAIILVILLVLFARWLYHKVHNGDQSTTGGTTQLPESSSPQQSQSALNQQLDNQSNPSPNSGSSSSNQNGKTITNTGPGNVAAIFAGSTLAAAGLHYIISLRRFNKNGY